MSWFAARRGTNLTQNVTSIVNNSSCVELDSVAMGQVLAQIAFLSNFHIFKPSKVFNVDKFGFKSRRLRGVRRQRVITTSGTRSTYPCANFSYKRINVREKVFVNGTSATSVVVFRGKKEPCLLG